MKAFLLVAILLLLGRTALCDEPSVQLRDFRSTDAKDAVKAYNDRVSFLEQSMQQHVETATAEFRDSLKVALEESAKQGDLQETERISRYLQADSPAANQSSSDAARKTINDLRSEMALFKKRLRSMAEPDPLTGVWRYEQGNVCNFTDDGWILLNGKRIALWNRTAENLYIAAFLNNFVDGVSDDMVLAPDGKTIRATSKRGKSFSIYRVKTEK